MPTIDWLARAHASLPLLTCPATRSPAGHAPASHLGTIARSRLPVASYYAESWIPLVESSSIADTAFVVAGFTAMHHCSLPGR